jgi:hypothetical protein
MKILVDKMPKNREDCIFYKGEEVFIKGITINMQKVNLYRYNCSDGQECDLNCGECHRLKSLC